MRPFPKQMLLFFMILGGLLLSSTAQAAPSRAPASAALANDDQQMVEEFNALQEEEEKANPNADLRFSEHHTALQYNLEANREALHPKNFHGKLGFNFQVNPSLTKMMDYTAIDLSYGFPFDWGWLDVMALKQSSTFARLGSHAQHPSTTDPSLKTKNDGIMLGIGTMLVADYPQELLGSWGKDVFATATTSITYLSYTDKDWDQTYSGPGFKIEAGFHYRVNKMMHVGIMGIYYMNILKTKTNGSNTYPKRLTVSWPSIGADMGYYF